MESIPTGISESVSFDTIILKLQLRTTWGDFVMITWKSEMLYVVFY